MRNKLKDQMVAQWSDKEDCFPVGFLDFLRQQWRTHDAIYEKATIQGVEALESWGMACKAMGDLWPQPSSVYAVSL